VQELGGWRTLSMVQRYAHLAPERLASAVERLVAPSPGKSSAGPAPAPQLRQDFGDTETRTAHERAVVS